MKSLLISMLLAGMATFWLSTSAHANNDAPGVDARRHHQQQRIGQGVYSGELTAAETRRLEREQRQIRQEERRYMADGSLSRGERADLHHDLNRSSRHIYNEKHDNQHR